MPTTAENQNTMEFLLDVPVKLTVELGNCEMTMKELLQLGIGAVVQLDKLANDPIDIFVNQKLVARGEIVVVEDNLGIKITEVSTGSDQADEESLTPDSSEEET
ncbi:MAG: flagellar motor switch protein FliN [Verrucomicrobiota bacterium]|jgi:flagellar motor switch protein FliN/FliY|nr:flagellar motor switch protein FliN [Verrucomicrobiota bacterium]